MVIMCLRFATCFVYFRHSFGSVRCKKKIQEEDEAEEGTQSTRRRSRMFTLIRLKAFRHKCDDDDRK